MLFVDIGNSWLKSAYYRDGVLHPINPVKTLTLMDEGNINWPLPDKNILASEKIFVSSVASEEVNQKCSKILRSNLEIEPHFVKVQKTFNGMTTLYRLDRLGVDRWLACMAAWSKFKESLIVVDVGTAITVDFINKEGTHLGGLIAPGPNVLSIALSKKTALLPSVSGHQEKFVIPTSTEEAIACGLESLLLGFIHQVRFESGQVYDSDPLWVLTGGASDIVSGSITWPHVIEPNLVLEGLKILAIG
jgi:type III pantothenate kinase